MKRRVAALETELGQGVVAVPIYEGESREAAIAAHIAAGGANPAGAEIAVFVTLFHPRTDRRMEVEVIRQSAADSLATLIYEARARSGLTHAGEC